MVKKERITRGQQAKDLTNISAKPESHWLILSTHPHLAFFFVCLFVRLQFNAQPYLTLCDPLNCSPPGSSVHGIFQVRMPEWLPFPPPGHLPNPGIKPTCPMSCALQTDSLPTAPLGFICLGDVFSTLGKLIMRVSSSI